MTIHLPEHLESSIRDAVQSGQFASMDDAMAEAARLLLRQLNQGQEGEVKAVNQAPAIEARKPIWERIQDMTADVPDEEWDKLPTDLAEQHDHYLYGTRKRPMA